MKRIIVILLCLLSYQNANSQDLVYSINYPNPTFPFNTMGSNAIILEDNADLICVSTCNPTASSKNQISVTKISKNGTVIWQQVWGNLMHTYNNTTAVLHGNEIVIFGTTSDLPTDPKYISTSPNFGYGGFILKVQNQKTPSLISFSKTMSIMSTSTSRPYTKSALNIRKCKPLNATQGVYLVCGEGGFWNPGGTLVLKRSFIATYHVNTNSISNISTASIGIPPGGLDPYANFDGMNKVPFPPFPNNGMPSCHP